MTGVLACLLSSCMSDTFVIAMGKHERKRAKMPFRPGEKLTYKMVWNLIPVGYFTAEIMDTEIIDETVTWHFRMRVKTNDFADTFYKVRNSIDSYAKADLMSSLKYDFDQRQGDTVDAINLTYDSNGKRVHVIKQGVDKGWSELPNLCVDPLTMFYAIRMQPITKAGQTFNVWVADGDKSIECPVLVVRKETLIVNEIPRECWLIQPDLKGLHSVFKKSDGAKLSVWVSADEHRIPLRMASRVIIGSFQGRLIEFQPGVELEPGEADTPIKTTRPSKAIVSTDKKRVKEKQ